tara:strand:- start:3005 stop:3280 length:276 start_codon:yes stop_codon:yes gene_type:complete
VNSNSDEFNKWGKLELISHHEIEAGELASIKLQFIVGSIGLDQAPEPVSDRSKFIVIDKDVQPGINPYWVKIIQQDMEMAWISPVFADRIE